MNSAMRACWGNQQQQAAKYFFDSLPKFKLAPTVVSHATQNISCFCERLFGVFGLSSFASQKQEMRKNGNYVIPKHSQYFVELDHEKFWVAWETVLPLYL